MHDKRSGGDLSHVNNEASALNEQLFGADDWTKCLLAEVEDAKRHNLQANVKALKAKSRKKEARKVLEKGLVDPWKRGRHGPLREGILTVNKAWFGGTGHEGWDPERVEEFRQTALAFLKQHFPDGQLRYSGGHADEEAYHIHFVVAVWHERFTVNRGHQRLLQASVNPLLGNYEKAQTLAGEAFKKLGITRGARRAEARRAAKAAGAPLPEKPRHIPPSEWRAKQRDQAQAEANKIMDTAAKKADALIEEASERKTKAACEAQEALKTLKTAQIKATAHIEAGRELSDVTIRKSRKRAIKEARKRKAKAEREAQKALKTAQIKASAHIERGRGLGDVAIRKSRKRASKEARELKAKAAREVAVETRRTDKLAKQAEQLQTAANAAGFARISAEAMTISLKRKAAAYDEQINAAQKQLRETKAEHVAETEVLENIRDDKAEADTARQKAHAEAEAEIARRDQAEAKARAVQDDLEKAQAATKLELDNVAAVKTERRGEEQALRQITDSRIAEEARLETLQKQANVAEVATSEIEEMVGAAEVGLDLIAVGTIVWSEDTAGGPRLSWGETAPKDGTERKQLSARFRPALAVVRQIAQLVARTVQKVLAAERQQLAEDAAFVAALREDWDAEQKERLDDLRGGSGPDWS
ncbi:plasmid recombination protein [Lentibacter sp. XHP0401]|uniref:plasmid recombination protein n=1 Tax=Lentibacter sp. XHP0401 TaxID=2984334 RepID=UPI0021E814D5|nr:plasmid recombination protein [Lentibacter sp. XHP0401]MCV2894997.1 plasmid recombination protein [Lentibacter sp. XHP0401]